MLGWLLARTQAGDAIFRQSMKTHILHVILANK